MGLHLGETRPDPAPVVGAPQVGIIKASRGPLNGLLVVAGMSSPLVLVLALVLGCVAGLPSASLESPNSRNSIQTGDDLMDSIYSDCLNKGSVSCVKYKLFSFVDKVLSSKEQFSLTEGVTVVKTPGAAVVGDGAPRALTPDDAQNTDVESMVTSRVEQFLQTHTVKIDLKGSDVLNAVSSAGRALGDAADSLGLSDDDAEETGRKKIKKSGKILLPLLLMMKLKAAALLPLILGAIALIAGKALLIGKIALLLASIIALKKLLSGQQKTVTYEIVSHPHHSSSHEHHGHDSFSSGGGDIGGGGYGGGGGHGGWGRSADAHDIAYNAYAPAKQ
ncbi:uncharacterized protein LOC128982224 [Macrosteles quadrilineatus]|uniref:uncharacterized protein LOC128982224 n=1 Tax=Macrosteles quadrilineatus TaxID=74068 RepID=UPI0023E2558D|nr:uncharacterized protein LOC128982224 [Macrosteles quadrilineatus]